MNYILNNINITFSLLVKYGSSGIDKFSGTSTPVFFKKSLVKLSVPIILNCFP